MHHGAPRIEGYISRGERRRRGGRSEGEERRLGIPHRARSSPPKLPHPGTSNPPLDTVSNPHHRLHGHNLLAPTPLGPLCSSNLPLDFSPPLLHAVRPLLGVCFSSGAVTAAATTGTATTTFGRRARGGSFAPPKFRADFPTDPLIRREGRQTRARVETKRSPAMHPLLFYSSIVESRFGDSVRTGPNGPAIALQVEGKRAGEAAIFENYSDRSPRKGLSRCPGDQPGNPANP